MDIGMGLIGTEAQNVQAFICLYGAYFAFKFTDLEGYKGKPVRIQLEDDHPVYKCPYKGDCKNTYIILGGTKKAYLFSYKTIGIFMWLQ
jgi:hypothetical protein